MSADGGYIKLWRKAREGWLWQLPLPQFKVAMTVLTMANWKDGSTWVKGKPVMVKRGQVMTSLPSLAAAANVSISQVRTALKNLNDVRFIVEQIFAGSHRIITVCNFEEYQDVGGEESQAVSTPVAGCSQAVRNDRRREEGKKGRKKKESKKKEWSAEELEIAEAVLGKLNHWLAEVEGPSYGVCDTNVEPIAKLLRAGYSEHDLRVVVWHRWIKWKGTEWEEYYRPSTLFAKSNFEGKYIAPARAYEAQCKREEKRNFGQSALNFGGGDG